MAKKLNKEVLLLVPRPTTVPEGSVPTMPILTIAGKKTTLTILRPGEVMKLGDGDGVKVVYGAHTFSSTLGKSILMSSQAPSQCR